MSEILYHAVPAASYNHHQVIFSAHQQVQVLTNLNFSFLKAKLVVFWGQYSVPGAVVRAVSLSHQVIGSKQPLCRFCGV